MQKRFMNYLVIVAISHPWPPLPASLPSQFLLSQDSGEWVSQAGGGWGWGRDGG